MTRPSNHFTNPRDVREQRDRAARLERAERHEAKHQRPAPELVPATEAGRQMLDGFAPMPQPDAQELHRRSAMGRRVKVHASILAIEAEARAELALRLLDHYVTAIDCDHEAKTDTVRCSCSIWTGTPQPSVRDAVRQWVDHVLERG